jgi:hypothetical protein
MAPETVPTKNDAVIRKKKPPGAGFSNARPIASDRSRKGSTGQMNFGRAALKRSKADTRICLAESGDIDCTLTNERDFPVPKVRRKPEAEMIEFRHLIITHERGSP